MPICTRILTLGPARCRLRLSADPGSTISTPHDTADDPQVVLPVHLAGPSDGASAFTQFLDEHDGWLRFSPDGGDTTVAVHEDLCARIQLDHEPALNGPRWTIAVYDSPVSNLSWHADFDVLTPHEIPLSVASSLSYALGHGSLARRDQAQWGSRPTREVLARDLRESGWQDVSTENQMEFRSPDGLAGLVRWDGGAHHRSPAGPDAPAPVKLWGGTGDQQWQATFTAAAPTLLITEALAELTEPLTAVRHLSEVPLAHRDLATVDRRQAAAASRSLHPSTAPSGTAAAAATATGPAAVRSARTSR
ncbi:DUF317 domain-containing protein [Kitasatospora sp. NPDC058032]|uniref:DUF317 domain-containing protein n=1 Tax=Kitasatospora sp. NPDC058032 TaxID=3346307 RepID=UPI0036DB4BFF